ncbi:MAG: hypothetical protein ACK4IX_11600, partial [Candidatus Sericytochromatia bacterium]
MGVDTIDVVNLNDYDKLVFQRFELGMALEENLERLLREIKNYKVAQSDVRKRNKIKNWIKKILVEGTPQKQYSATISTILLNEDIYSEIKSNLTELNFWDEELRELESSCRSVLLE